MTAILPTEMNSAKHPAGAKWAGRLTVMLLTGLGFCLIAKILLEHATVAWVEIMGTILLLIGMATSFGVAFFGGAGMFFTLERARAEEAKGAPHSPHYRQRIRFLWLSAGVLLAPFILRQWHMRLASPAPTDVYVTRPIVFDEGQYSIRRDGTNVFSLWRDMFDGPEFIYMFADGQRFLCMYDHDTAYLVFVADLNPIRTNTATAAGWPHSGVDGQYIAQAAARVTTITNGITRLPTWPEVKEVADYLNRLPTGQFNAQSLDKCDLGLFQVHTLPKQFLLQELSTNHHSLW